MSLASADALSAARKHGDFDALIARIPYARFLGMQAQIRAAIPRFHLPFDQQLIGNARLPALHGGVIAAFMETAAQLHILWAQAETRIPKSIDFSIDYLRSGRAQDLWCECEITRQGRRVAQAQMRCWQADPSRPVALARAHFLLQDPDQDGSS